MTDGDEQRGPGALPIMLILGWLGSLAVIGFLLFDEVMGQWAANADGYASLSSDRGDWLLLLLGIAVFAWPLVISLVGFRQGRRALGMVCLILGLILLLPGGMLVLGAAKELRPPPPPAPPVTQCMEHSGGDNSCPGG